MKAFIVTSNTRSLLLSGIAMSALTATQLAFVPAAFAQSAQDEDVKAAGSEDSRDNVIVVTARKREETLTDVPVSISAVSADELDRAGIDNITSLFATMPGVENNSDGSRLAAKPTIRGVGSTENASIRAKVTSFIDGVPTIGSQGIGAFGGLQQVEVLRGPQSAAFGRSTFGGAINYVTRDPGNSTELSLRLGLATDDSYRIGITGATPLVGDHVRLLVALDKNVYGGSDQFVTTSGDQLGAEDNELAMVKLGFGSTDAFQAEIMYMYQNVDDGAYPLLFANLDQLTAHPLNPAGTCAIDGNGAASCVILGAVDTDAVPRIFDYDYDNATNPVLNPGTRVQRHRVQGKVSTEFSDGHSITAVGMFSDEEADTGFDRDLFTSPANKTIHVVSTPDITEYYGELRVASPADGPISWLVGASIYDYDYTNTVFANFSTGAVMDIFAEKATNIGGFFNLGFNLTDDLSISAEGRYQIDKISGAYPANPARGASEAIGNERTTKSFQPRLSINYALNPSANVYVQIARGTNPAGFNLNALDPILQTTAASESFELASFESYDEETMWNYEFGVKGAGSGFQYSAAIYYIDLKGYVQPVTANWTPADNVRLPGTSPNDYFSRVFVNTGNLNGIGAEFEGAWQISDALEVSGSVAYNGATFSDDSCSPIPVDYGVPALQTSPFRCASVGGNVPSLVSRYTTSLAATYTVPLSASVDGFVRADHSWRSKRYTQQINTDYLQAYHTVNLRAGVRIDSDLTVELFANNLLDDDTPSGAVRFFDPRLTAGMTYNTSFQPRRPRQFGLNLSYDY